MNRIADIETWLRETYIPVLSGNAQGTLSNEAHLASDGTSFIIGLTRIRQIRSTGKLSFQGKRNIRHYSSISNNNKKWLRFRNSKC